MNRRHATILTTLVLLFGSLLIQGCQKEETENHPSTANANSKLANEGSKTPDSKAAQDGATSESGKSKPSSEQVKKKTSENTKQADRVTIRYCILGQQGSGNLVDKDRTAEQAAHLAALIEQHMQQGDDRNKIILRFKNEKLGGVGTGTLTLLNFGVQGADPSKHIVPRETRPIVAPVAFGLQVGEITTIPFDPNLLQKGLGTWVIQRLK